jgi:hypothetical protein
MLPDNRLDFISNIHEDFIAEMTEIRKDFIALDRKLRNLSGYDEANKNGALRSISLARTDIETALQYTIKALCLMGEKTEGINESNI